MNWMKDVHAGYPIPAYCRGGILRPGVPMPYCLPVLEDESANTTVQPKRKLMTPMSAEQRILELGIHLPAAKPPAGNYVSAMQTGNLLFTSGRAPLTVDGNPPRGRLGREYSVSDGYALARSACIDLLSVLKHQLGSLDRVSRFIELHGAICAVPEFEEHAAVLDGASNLLIEVFGPAGIHVRSVIGVSSLRNGVPITVRATVEVESIQAALQQI